MILRRALGLVSSLGLIVALTGCGSLFHDRANDYRTARELPPLTLPVGQDSRPIKPLYPIPAGSSMAAAEGSKKFQAPQPKPLLLATDAANPSSVANIAVVPEKPVLTQDGNAYPVLNIAGDFNAIWDRLDSALRTSNVKIDDRDQRTGLYYLDMPGPDGKKAIYQLRVTRSQSAYILALQKDDDTLAPEAMTRTLFESIVSHWPPESGEINGKARTPLHR